MNKKQLYESIMRSVSNEVKKALNESDGITQLTVQMMSKVVFHIQHIFKEYKDEAAYWIDKLGKEYHEVEQISQDTNSMHVISERLKSIRMALKDAANYGSYINSYDEYVQTTVHAGRSMIIGKEKYEKLCRMYLNAINDRNVIGYDEIPVFDRINEIIALVEYLEQSIKSENANINGTCRRINTIVAKFNKVRMPIIDASEIFEQISNE